MPSMDENTANMKLRSTRALRNWASKSPERLNNGNVREGGLRESSEVSDLALRSRDWGFDANGGGSSDRDMAGRSRAGSVEERDQNMRERTGVNVLGVSRSPPGYDSRVRDKVGSWVDRIEREEEETAGRSVSPMARFTDWVGAEGTRDGFERNRSPMRRGRERSDEGLSQLDSNFRRMQVTARADQVSMEGQYWRVDKYGRPLEASGDYWVHGVDHGLGSLGRPREEFARSHGTASHYGDERSPPRAFHGDPRAAGDYRMVSSYADVGPFDRHPDSLYGYGTPRGSFQRPRGSAVLSKLELERAQLLQKYYEIKDQLSRGGPGSREKWTSSPPSRFSGSEEFVEEQPLRLNAASPLRLSNKSPSRSISSECDDPYLPQLGMSPRGHPPSQLESVCSLQCMGLHPDSYEFHHPHDFFHHGTCPGSHCHINNWQAHSAAPYAAFDGRRLKNIPTGRVSSHNGGYGAVVRDYRLPDHDSVDPSHVNCSSDHNLNDNGSFTHHHQKRVLVSDLNRWLCYPLAGGAPFILCYNCFGLLKLPRKIMRMERNRCRLQCGACSARMAINLENNMSVVPIHQSGEHYANNNSIDKSNGGVLRNSRDSAPKVQSYDSDAKCSSCQSIYSQPDVRSYGWRQNSNGDEKRERPSSDSSHSSREASKHEKILVPRAIANSDETLVKNDLVRPPPGAPLQEHFDYSFALRQLESARNVNCATQAKGADEQDALKQRSVEAAAIAAEMEVFSIEFTNNSASDDSNEVSIDTQVGTSSSTQSTSAAFITGFRNLDSHHGSDKEQDVFVNGQLISPRELRKAEKQAGRISPGSYWYDSKAGFWGVKGHHCLGIIPPCIEEFSMSMAVDCAGGNTAVFVNDRELHSRDLELLASRGLPTTRGKSYAIEISGKVYDEDTGVLVAKLGRLAPTVEKAKRGFGMWVPKTLEE